MEGPRWKRSRRCRREAWRAANEKGLWNEDSVSSLVCELGEQVLIAAGGNGEVTQ